VHNICADIYIYKRTSCGRFENATPTKPCALRSG
jgi:hypothetical protein